MLRFPQIRYFSKQFFFWGGGEIQSLCTYRTTILFVFYMVVKFGLLCWGMNKGWGMLCYCHIGVCTWVRACVYFITKCHVTCNKYQVFHVRTYFLCLRTKYQETCNSYQVFHVRIFYLLVSGVYQHLCEFVEWHHLHSLQPLTLIVLMWRIGWAHNNARK